MIAAGIAPFIVPIGPFRIRDDGPPPQELLASVFDDRPYLGGLRLGGKQFDEPLVALQRIECDHGRVGIVAGQGLEIFLGSNRRGDSDRRWRVHGNAGRRRWRCLRIEPPQFDIERSGVPWYLSAVRRVAYLQARRLQDLFEFEAWLAHLCHQQGGIEPGDTVAVDRDTVRCRRGGDHQALRRLHDAETLGKRVASGLSEIMLPRRIKDDDARMRRERGQFADQVTEPEGFRGDVGVGGDIRVDRQQEIVAVMLHTKTREVEDNVGTRAALCDFVQEVTERLTKIVRAQILKLGNVVTGRAQGLRDEPRIGGRCWQRADMFVVGVGDDESNTGLSGRVGYRKEK